MNDKNRKLLGKIVKVDLPNWLSCKWIRHCKYVDLAIDDKSAFEGAELSSGTQELPVGAIVVYFLGGAEDFTVPELYSNEPTKDGSMLVAEQVVIDKDECGLTEEICTLIGARTHSEKFVKFRNTVTKAIRDSKPPIKNKIRFLFHNARRNKKFIFIARFMANFVLGKMFPFGK